MFNFCVCDDLHTEQNFFEKVKQLAQSHEAFLSQTQEHLGLKEEFAKLGESEIISLLDYTFISCESAPLVVFMILSVFKST